MKLKPPQAVALSFLAAIIMGSLLLGLPFSHRAGEAVSVVDAVFTATSAVCVTGLIVKDTGSGWSPFGQAVILVLFQIGGLGIMTLSTFFAILLGRKLTLRENLVIRSTLDRHGVQGLRSLIKYILLITFGIELCGAALLFWRWSVSENWGTLETACRAVFHSVSAFCNAGFSLFATGLRAYGSDPWVNTVFILLIFLGGIGFVVLVDIIRGLFFERRRRYAVSRFSLQSKLALSVSGGLILIGALTIFLLESGHLLKGMAAGERVMASVFQAVTSRTAGFNTLETGALRPASLLFIVLLMFIGASPGSTGGGIKTCTMGVLLATWRAMLRNRGKVTVFRRTIPREAVRKAIMIFCIAIGWILAGTFLMILFEGRAIGEGNILLRSLFEVTSAFGTVGLTTGITPHLNTIGKILIITTMFVGRVGPLTLALAIPMRGEKAAYGYAEEQVMVG